MSTLPRTIKNIWKAGLKDSFHQMNTISDTKAGTLVGVDRMGNKYFENLDEVPFRTRWVQYARKHHDASDIEPGWSAWLKSMESEPPTQDKMFQEYVEPWQSRKDPSNHTFELGPWLSSNTRGAFKTYSTVVPIYHAWEPKTKQRA